ncbi:hypothetical protein MKK88_23025 [Methylobacterium sp. E-005]|uniref:hypothetical protein n=1 Tax=Methylobacterium sp. E-005 TaxID=2836549 RepID=UPI001FBA7123|nr:hypothetical protein [Methylobacterium sp. E-005]MCJ2088829.1 hypothetical protein [Methylobacterium sp. E-005]
MAKTRNPVDTAYRVAAARAEQNAAIQKIGRGVSSAATGAQGVIENAGMWRGRRETAAASDAVRGLARDPGAPDRTVRGFLAAVTAA